MEPQPGASILPANTKLEAAEEPTALGEHNMSIREERLMILRMVEEGKISPEEGAKLLAAIGDNQVVATVEQVDSFDMTRMLRIRVSDTFTGQEKVNVNLPIGFVRFGLRFVPESASVDVAAILAALDSGVRGRIIDVFAEEDGKHVEIFIE